MRRQKPWSPAGSFRDEIAVRQDRSRKSDARAGASPAVRESVASEVGAELRSARERLTWRIPDLAAMLRIRNDYLEALEQGRISDLPGRTYAIGFLRTYAEALGLDPDELVHRFKSEAAREPRKAELEFPAPVPERGVPVGAVAPLGVLLVVGAYAGWYRLSGEGRLPAETVPPIPERLAPLTEQGVPAPRPAPPAPGQASSESAPPASPAPAAPTAVAEPSIPPSSAAAAVPASPTAEEAASPQSAASLPPTPETSRIVLRARADAWMQVRDRAGQVLLNRILRAGESWPVPAGADLVLTTGNAGGTELVVDGAVAPSLGNTGVVRRDVPLEASLIKDGKLPAQVQAATQNPRNAAVQ
jgi:cytoskeleton protein RodZ